MDTINNVSIGNKFKTGAKNTAEVVDLIEKRSLTSGKIVGYICIARGLGLAKNEFEVPFSTVVRNII